MRATPSSWRRAYDEQKRRRGDFFGHHRHERRPRHHGGAREPRLGRAAPPILRGRRLPQRGRYSQDDRRRRRQGVGELGGRGEPSAHHRCGPGLRHSGDSVRHRRESGARQSRTSGRSTWPVAARTPTSTPSNGLARRLGAGRGRSCSPPWIATAAATASTVALTRAVARAVDIPVIASGRRGQAGALRRGRHRGRGRRRAGRQRLPLRRAHRAPSKRIHARRRHPRAAVGQGLAFTLKLNYHATHVLTRCKLSCNRRFEWLRRTALSIGRPTGRC